MARHIPRRRCAGCGRVAPKSELVRLAVERDAAGRARRVVLDRAGTMPGRGAYLCRAGTAGSPSAACAEQARRRGGIARALRSGAPLGDEIVESVSR